MKSIKYILPFILLITFITACQEGNVKNESQKNTSTLKEDSLILVGKSIAEQAFKTLSGHLQQQLQEGGIDSAIKYCNINAYNLTDSLSKTHNAIIKRVAERNRNENNALTEEEKEVFLAFKNKAFSSPQIQINKDGKYVFYAPIKLNPMCVMCHGTKEQIGESYSLISSLYPDDKAYGFVPEELRGMWSITFN